MNNRKLALLAIVAMGMVSLAVVTTQKARGPKKQTVDEPTYLIQGLDPTSIDKIVIGDGNDAVTLKAQPMAPELGQPKAYFTVSGKSDYPADNKQVNELITNCLDLQVTDIVTQTASNYADLGLTPDKAQTVVQFFKADGRPLTGLVISQPKEGGQGSYCRRLDPNDTTVYAAPKVPWFRTKALDYLNQDLISAKQEDIQSISVTDPNGNYALRDAANGEGIVMENLPAGKKLKVSDARSVLSALDSVRFEDVRKAPDAKLQFTHRMACTLKDSTVYSIRIAKDGGKTFITLDAQYTDPNKVSMDPSKVDSPEELKKKEAKLLAQEKALLFSARHKGWIYELPSWKSKYLTYGLADLLEDLPRIEEPNNSNAAAEPNVPNATGSIPTPPLTAE